MGAKRYRDIMKVDLVNVSSGNSKLGSIPNISLRPILDCTNCEDCKNDCYAIKPYQRWDAVKNAWDQNSLAFRRSFYLAFFQLAEWIQRNGPEYFRIHVGGDFLNQYHVDGYIKLAEDYPETRFLAFTKRYELDFKRRPKNLAIIQSLWPGSNHPRKRGLRHSYLKGDPRIPRKGVFECTGHCETCYECWNGTRDIVLHKV